MPGTLVVVKFYAREEYLVRAAATLRRVTMNSSTKDKSEGALHQVKGAVKEVAGIISDNSKLEAEGAAERVGGKLQQKIGQFNQFWGK